MIGVCEMRNREIVMAGFGVGGLSETRVSGSNNHRAFNQYRLENVPSTSQGGWVASCIASQLSETDPVRNKSC